MAEIYVSTDVETDGPIPGPHSMLSFGPAAYTRDKKRGSTYSAKRETLDGAAGDSETMDWWKTQSEARVACREHPRSSSVVMPEYRDWVEGLPGTPVFVAWPTGFDCLFVYGYLIRFAGRSPFSFSARGVRTYAMAVLGRDYRDCVKGKLPKRWFDRLPHTHVALDDAIEQGALFCNMLAERGRRGRCSLL